MTRRETVMKWWNKLSPMKKQAHVFIMLGMPERSHKTLTGREIEKLYDFEHALDTPKQN